MLVRFRETAAGLQGSLVETRRIDGKVRYEHVASFGSVPASPSVADRIALWRRVYETLAELADRIDAETQGKIISAVHSRIPIVTPNEQRALRVRPRPQQPDKASRHEGAKERPQNKAPISGSDAGTLPLPRVPSLQGMQTEHAQIAEERPTQVENGKRIESGFSKSTAVEELTTVLVHLLQYSSVPLTSADRGDWKLVLSTIVPSALKFQSVSYTHLTLPTNREV